MTRIEALSKVSYATGARDQLEPDVTLILCETCTRGLLQELARLFPEGCHGSMTTLQGSRIFGCTTIDGPPEQCALHPFFHEADVCP